MKSKLLTTSVLFFATSLFSQLPQDYGFKFGLIQSEQEWNYIEENIQWTNIENSFKKKNGLKIGLFAEWKLISNINVLVEINYAQKGSKMEIETRTITNPEGIGDKIDWLYSVDYFEIPLQLKFHINTSNFKIFTTAGYRYDYLYYRKAFGTTLQKDLGKSNWGFSTGIGIELIKLFKTPLILELRYNPDQTFMYETDKLQIINSTLDILVGVKL